MYLSYNLNSSWADPLSKPHPQNLITGKVRLVGNVANVVVEFSTPEAPHIKCTHQLSRHHHLMETEHRR